MNGKKVLAIQMEPMFKGSHDILFYGKLTDRNFVMIRIVFILEVYLFLVILFNFF